MSIHTIITILVVNLLLFALGLKILYDYHKRDRELCSMDKNIEEGYVKEFLYWGIISVAIEMIMFAEAILEAVL